MKKAAVFFLFVVVFPFFVHSQDAVAIDTALKNSVSYLNGRMTAGAKVVVLNFSSSWPQLTDYIIEELIGYIVNEGTLTVVDRANLEMIRKEMDFQLSGEVSDATAQSIGQKLGAQNIISGSIVAIGSSYRLRIRAISVETAQIVGMQNIDVVQDSRIAALTGTAFAAAPAVRPASNAASVTPATDKTVPAVSAASSSLFASLKWDIHADAENAAVKRETAANINMGREFIDGRERDILTLIVDLGRGNGWKTGIISTVNPEFVHKLKNGSGVRFKVQGDGKAGWRVRIRTSDVTDNQYHEQVFSTRSGRVTDVNLQFNRLKQPEWVKGVTFNKSKITGFEFQRICLGHETISGPSTIKIFDIEAY
ncbi:MAG: CsgG/HfaB family protein [Treponema sp.]|jgi:TolB-like protein|nr:CsgG/HfaB family protein [Treponema sp.]